MPRKSSATEKTKQSQKQEQNVKIVINQADKKKQTKGRKKRASKQATEAYLTPEQRMRMFHTYAPPQITYNTMLPNSDILNVLRSNLSRNDGILPIANDVRQRLNPAVRQEIDQIQMVNRVADRARNAYVGPPEREPDPVIVPPAPAIAPAPVQPAPEPQPRRRAESAPIEISSRPNNVVVNQEPLNEILRRRERAQSVPVQYRDYGGGVGGIYEASPVPIPRRVIRIVPFKPNNPQPDDIAPVSDAQPEAPVRQVGSPSPSAGVRSPAPPSVGRRSEEPSDAQEAGAPSTALVVRPQAELVPAKKQSTLKKFYNQIVKVVTPNKKNKVGIETEPASAVPAKAVEMGIVPYIPPSPNTNAPEAGIAPAPATSLSPSQIGPQGQSMRSKMQGAKTNASASASAQPPPFASDVPRNKDGTFKKNSKEYRALARSVSPEELRMYENSTRATNPNFGKLNL